MKVLILGGTGVFGERIARLLARDGHQLTIAARSLPAAEPLPAPVVSCHDPKAVPSPTDRYATCHPTTRQN
jgi:uncharacterized protein YbjT (DUF2867 family)